MATTTRGHIEELPSGAFRVHVYAGTDAVTGKPRRLRETCPDEAAAAIALGRLLSQADGARMPNRAATLGQALDKYLEVADLEISTREAPGLPPPHHQAGTRRSQDPEAWRGLARLAVHGTEEVLTAVRAAPKKRALHRR